MRAKFLTLASATALGLVALTSLVGTAQAHEGYRHNYFRYLHVGHRDYGHGYFFRFRHDHDRR